MNFLISLLYAPLIFICLKYYDIKIVSIAVFFLSALWLIYSLKKDKKSARYPFLYMGASLVTFFLEKFLVLKSIPLIASVIIATTMLISYINKSSIILYFASRFSKKEIGGREKQYIQSSTLFWIVVSAINILCHIFVFINNNIKLWVYYSSFGWYFVFGLAGILQFLHRKFLFSKRH